ncbi:MAG: YesL family protein [Firmicutes bacterium]|nr:YesL family protein [Bacillota bacterium]
MGFKDSIRTFWRALKLSYEHIGKVMVTNLIWFGAGFFLLLLFTYLPVQSDWFFALVLLGTPITIGGALGAVHFRMNALVKGEETVFGDIWEGFRRYFFRGAILAILAVLGFAILFFNIWFSQNYPSKLFLLLSGFWIWGIVLWYAMHQFVFPFVVNQNAGVFSALKKAALMVLDNPWPSFLLVIFSLIVIVISVVFAAPLLIFLASFLALLQNCFYHELMVKYELLAAEKDGESEGEDQV